MATLSAKKLSVYYEDKQILHHVNITCPQNKITVILGPNGCGKSTLLKTMARLQKPKEGNIYLDGEDIHRIPTKHLAKRLGILPQSAEVPQQLTVHDLISFGRTPYQSGFRKKSKEDDKAIQWAIEVTGLEKIQDQELDTLSGGQRQRAWIAMCLAQDTEVILLDEPTTYLDMAHQLEILQLLQRLNEEEGRTIVMVLHDLNHAARFGHYLVAMKDGKLVKDGTPKEVVEAGVLKEVFQIDAVIVEDHRKKIPVVLSYDLIR